MHGALSRAVSRLALTLLVASLSVIAIPEAAQARCVGQGGRTTSTLVVSGLVYVTEVPREGTCNRNNHYSAQYRSEHSGWRASVWIQNGGSWSGYYGNYGTGWQSYEYHDNNSHSYIHLCLDNGTIFICGWGHSFTNGFSHAHYGENTGY